MTSLYGVYLYTDDSLLRHQLNLYNQFRQNPWTIKNEKTIVSRTNPVLQKWLQQCSPEIQFLLDCTHILPKMMSTPLKTPQTLCLPSVFDSGTSLQLDSSTSRQVLEHFWFPTRIPWTSFLSQTRPIHEFAVFNIFHRYVPVCVYSTKDAVQHIFVDQLPVKTIFDSHDLGIPWTILILDASWHQMMNIACQSDMYTTSN